MDYDLLKRRISESQLPIHQTVARELQNAIESGTLADGSKLPPDKIFAAELGINHITLAKALNALRAQGFLQRRRSAGTFITRKREGIRPDKRIAVVFDEASAETFQCSFFLALHRELAASGFSMVFYSADGTAQKQYSILQSILSDPTVDGCLFWSILTRAQAEEILRCRPSDFPLVFVDRTYEGLTHDAATYDDFNSAKELGHTLRARGFSRIAWVQRSGSNVSSVNRRFAGLCDGLGEVRPEQGPVAEKNAEVLIFASEVDYRIVLRTSSPPEKLWYTFAAMNSLPGILFDCADLAAGAVEILKRRFDGENVRFFRTTASWKFIEQAAEQKTGADAV